MFQSYRDMTLLCPGNMRGSIVHFRRAASKRFQEFPESYPEYPSFKDGETTENLTKSRDRDTGRQL
ncbi:hypothetical protein Saso_45920 [Streptomyces asoensis]|uniref:Uncharacterized protein n=1 Tax=Streptomyces asoensis TaxID=249586 RepID=A0ABQ3S4S7_9ACTN|nr:hypothetical protein GCM10010496_23880 [Streptomyces asoensis]GHI62942.1 hypothetical protein Saso_45920 [Streptomyces asoensis]